MENMVNDLKRIFAGKRVFVTGHTGFKGVWLMEMLDLLGAETFGYALAPEGQVSHYNLIGKKFQEKIGDINDPMTLSNAILDFSPDLLIHMAAQSLVRQSYKDPVETYQTNVMGSLQVLHAAAHCRSLSGILMITTDKVYENKEIHYAYRESDRLGGYDMYSSSKACCEILIDSFRRSFLSPDQYGNSHHIILCSARSGNVIGGGDWNQDRLIPDLVASATGGVSVAIRNPVAVRPWQHVLDCLNGYLMLSARMMEKDLGVSGAWNFAPNSDDVLNVKELADEARKNWDKIQYHLFKDPDTPHEAGLLLLDHHKAVSKLGWKPRYRSEQSVRLTMDWYKAFYENNELITRNQIEDFLKSEPHEI